MYVCVCLLMLNLSAHVSRRWLNRFEQIWAHLEALVVPLIKFKRIMADTTDPVDITEKVT